METLMSDIYTTHRYIFGNCRLQFDISVHTVTSIQYEPHILLRTYTHPTTLL